MDDLPDIDTVLISHNHYDHLDLQTLRQLAARRRSTFIVAARGAGLLRSQKIEPFYELDWGESVTLSGFTVHGVPALHFSARGIFDRNKALWCGYAIEYSGRLVYFAGDTSFGGHFAQIRERFGSPPLALLPIGAYEPRWFMSPVHMAPKKPFEPMKFSVPRPASRSTMEPSNWQVTASTPHRDSLWLAGETIRF